MGDLRIHIRGAVDSTGKGGQPSFRSEAVAVVKRDPWAQEEAKHQERNGPAPSDSQCAGPRVHVARGAISLEYCSRVVSRLGWNGSLSPAGPGNRCTIGHSFTPDDPPPPLESERFAIVQLLRQILLHGEILPLRLEDVAHARGWASSTPAGVPIQAHAHDGDVVVAVYLAVPEDPEPLEFVQRKQGVRLLSDPRSCSDDPIKTEAIEILDLVSSVIPEPGMVLAWPSSLEHRVPEGPRRAGERVCCAWNITLGRGA